jgi:hypothetical protein
VSATLTYTLPNDLSQLHDELLAAVPALRPAPGPDGALVPVMTVLGQGDVVRLIVPDGTDTAAVDAVVAAHVPQARYDPATRQAAVGATLAAQRRRALFRNTRTAVRAAPDVAALRAAVLGLIDAVEELV